MSRRPFAFIFQMKDYDTINQNKHIKYASEKIIMKVYTPACWYDDRAKLGSGMLVHIHPYIAVVKTICCKHEEYIRSSLFLHTVE